MASEYPSIERGWVKTVGQNQKIKKEAHMETAECNQRGLLTANRFICDAYSKMSQINSPQYMFSIPQEIGHGYFKQISTPQGIIVSEFRMHYKSDMEVMGRTDVSTIDICFCLEEGIQWEWQDACKQLHINRGESFISNSRNGIERNQTMENPTRTGRHGVRSGANG